MPDIFIEPDKKKSTSSESAKPVDHQAPISGAETVGEEVHTTHPRPKPAHKTTFKSKFGPTVSGSTHQKRAMFPLSAFAMDPQGVSFANQGANEEIHLFLRRHFITNLPWIIFAAVLLALPALAPFIGSFVPFTDLLSPSTTFVLLIFYYTVVFGAFILTNFINWYFNVYIVTNERVVDVDFVNILYREVSATRLNLIQDVTVKTGGVFRAVFDYGDVFIQTAGTETNFDFHAVPHAQQVAREIEKLMELARSKEGVSDIEVALTK